MNTVTLVHMFNKERKTLPVDHITRTYVSLRWGQSGIYDLNLAKNVLTARSQKAQRKGKALWSALDIEAVRSGVRCYLNSKHGKDVDETRQKMRGHAATMPNFSSMPALNTANPKPQTDTPKTRLVRGPLERFFVGDEANDSVKAPDLSQDVLSAADREG